MKVSSAWAPVSIAALAVLATVSSALVAGAAEIGYVGADGGAFGLVGNWAGGRLPGRSDVAVVPDGRTVVASSPADIAALKATGELRLAGASARLEVRDAAVDFPTNGARLSGTGEFRAVASGTEQPEVCLSQDNSAFAGSFFFTNVHPVVCGPKALGRNCPVTFHKTRADGRDAFTFAAPGVYASDIEIHHPRGAVWYSLSATGFRGRVVNRGKVSVGKLAASSCLRFQAGRGVRYEQAGEIETGIRVNLNGDVLLDGPLSFSGTGETVFSDGAEGCVRIGPRFSLNGAKGTVANVVALRVPGRLGVHQTFMVETEGADDLPPGVYEADLISDYLNGGRAVRAAARTDEAGRTVLPFTPATPIARIRNQVRAIRSLDRTKRYVVSLAEGTYPLTETVDFDGRDSGTAENPVVWRGGGKGAVFSGAVELTGARADAAEPDVWRFPVPRDAAGRPMWADCLFVDGARREVAAYPAEGFIHATNVTERILAKEGTYKPWDYSVAAEHTVFLTDADFASLADLMAVDQPYLRVRIHSKWNSARHLVTRIDCRTRSVTFGGTRWPPWNRYKADECPLRFENLRPAFRQAGQWFYDARRLEIAYRPQPGESVAALRVTVPQDGLETFFRFSGDIDARAWAGNVRFENLTFETAAPMGACGPVDVPDSLMLNGFADSMFTLDGVRGVTFDRCRWTRTGSYGVWFRDGCMSNAVVNCVFTDLGGGAIRVGRAGGNRAVKGLFEVAPTGAVAYAVYVPHSTAFISIENNLVEHGGRFLPGAGAIVVSAASDCRIVHNRIDDLHYSAIVCGWDFGYRGSPCQRNLVAFNHISNVGYGDLSDMAGVYMAGTGFGNLITDNVIHGVKGMVYGGWGLYPDEGTEGVVYRNNLVYDTKDGAVHQHFGRNNVFENNIFGFAREGQLAITRAEPWRSYSMVGNIIVWEEGPAFVKYAGTLNETAKINWTRNLWWRLDGNDRVFNGKSFAEWQAKGNDTEGAFADPKFVDAARRDFRLRPDSPALKLGFKPFDFTRAGLVDAGNE